MSWLQPSDEDRNFVQALLQAEPETCRLLSVLALALRIEPLLLRNARLHFVPDAGQGIEMELEIWFSGIMVSRNAKACVMRGGIARALADGLAKKPEDFAEARMFVQTHTRHWNALDQLEQELRLAARNNDSGALRNGFNRLLKTLLVSGDDTKKRDLSRWAKGAIPALIASGQTDETGHLLFQYSAAALGLPASWCANLRPDMAAMPQWLIDALPDNKQNSIGIQMRQGVLECLRPETARHVLDFKLPLPTPVLLSFDPMTEEARWESLWIGRKIRIPLSLQSLTLQTLDGTLYRFVLESVDSVKPDEGQSALLPLLVYMPGDLEQARLIADRLKQHGIELELVQDKPIKADASASKARPLLRLWTPASADYWQKMLPDAGEPTEIISDKGLLIRTDPNIALPSGFFSNLSFDLTDYTADLEQLASIVRNWLTTGELKIAVDEKIDPTDEIDALLEELENPETRPRRRLEIGDRLAELGDPRQGVGVKEYEIIEYPPEIRQLLDELADIETEPPRRLAIGDRLAELGDLRPGVGLNDHGLPDIDWVEIPAGPFIYGEKETRQTIELPHFYISRYPVTNRQYQAFIDAGGYEDERWWQDLIKPEPKESKWQQTNRPRETVDWYEAVAFTRWLSAQLGYDITLPTEQQWEKAARGTDGRLYPWGDEYQPGYANINETFHNTGPYYLQETSAVGVYPHDKSPYGVLDMAGNVWEWCLNKYGKREEIVPDRSHESRVVRGGSGFFSPGSARCSSRLRFDPGGRSGDFGFRVVCSSPSTEH